MAWQRTATKGVYYDRDKKRYKITWRQRRADGKVYQTSETVGSLDKAKKIKKLADLHGDRPDMEGVIRGTDFVGHRGRSYSQTPRKIQTTAPTYNSIEHYMPRFLANHGYRQGSRSELQ